MTDPKRAGMVFRAAGCLAFLPASVVQRVAALPPISSVAGAPEGVLGIAHDSGEIMPIFAIGPDRGALLICSYRGQSIGLIGARDLRAGLFEPDAAYPDCVLHEGHSAARFDMAAIYERLDATSWASRSTQ